MHICFCVVCPFVCVYILLTCALKVAYFGSMMLAVFAPPIFRIIDHVCPFLIILEPVFLCLLAAGVCWNAKHLAVERLLLVLILAGALRGVKHQYAERQAPRGVDAGRQRSRAAIRASSAPWQPSCFPTSVFPERPPGCLLPSTVPKLTSSARGRFPARPPGLWHMPVRPPGHWPARTLLESSLPVNGVEGQRRQGMLLGGAGQVGGPVPGAQGEGHGGRRGPGQSGGGDEP